MAKSTHINKALDAALEQTSGLKPVRKKKEKTHPIYKKYTEGAIPVSDRLGNLWKSRRDVGLAKRKRNQLEESWEQALNYYKHDQLKHRDSGSSGERSGNFSITNTRRFFETENIVFSNVNSVVPLLYAKNPRAEVTSVQEGSKQVEGAAYGQETVSQQARVYEHVLNRLAELRAAPGINLKPKAKQAVILAKLTNCAWLEVGYTKKEESSEEALTELQRISTQLATAKDEKEIRLLEGQLLALERSVNMLAPGGPSLRLHPPQRVIDDPDVSEGMPRKWMMVYDFVETAYLKAVYAQGHPAGEQWRSIFNPTHVVSLAGNDNADELESFTLFNYEEDTNDARRHGYGDQESYERAQRTKVWWVWCGTTRRLLLYNDKDWSWPIWVWDDPLHLDTFFPFTKLAFLSPVDDSDAKGEVNYYLDQQDAINEINDEERRARQMAKNKVFYNKNVIRSGDVDKFLSSATEIAYGIDAPLDADLKNAITAIVPPSLRYPELFNKKEKIEAANRISRFSEFLAGREFKTNTTNQAIARYESTQNTGLDEYIDAVEDCLGNVFWQVLQLCLQFMTQEEVAQLVGVQMAEYWPRQPLTPKEIRRTVRVRVVGGSTVKPTSAAKKQEALEVGQVLGQYAGAAPYAILIALQLFEEAFDGIDIRAEHWQLLRQSIEAQLQRGNSQQQGSTQQGAQQGSTQQTQGQVTQAIDQLPPDLKQKFGKLLGELLVRGVPAETAIPRLLARITQSTQQ